MTAPARPAREPITGSQVSRPDDSELATAIAAFTGWRAWRTRDGELAAREGGCPPAGAHARGPSLAELTHAIEAAINAGPPPSLRRAERAALDVLTAAPAPLRVRAVPGAAGLHLSPTAKALTALHGRGLATRHRDGRTWLTPATADSPPHDSPPTVTAGPPSMTPGQTGRGSDMATVAAAMVRLVLPAAPACPAHPACGWRSRQTTAGYGCTSPTRPPECPNGARRGTTHPRADTDRLSSTEVGPFGDSRWHTLWVLRRPPADSPAAGPA